MQAEIEDLVHVKFEVILAEIIVRDMVQPKTPPFSTRDFI